MCQVYHNMPIESRDCHLEFTHFFYSSFPLVFSACPESVGSTDPTILPARKVVLALAYDPLDNREIAFGVARFALHLFS